MSARRKPEKTIKRSVIMADSMAKAIDAACKVQDSTFNKFMRRLVRENLHRYERAKASSTQQSDDNDDVVIKGAITLDMPIEVEKTLFATAGKLGRSAESLGEQILAEGLLAWIERAATHEREKQDVLRKLTEAQE